MYTDVLETHIVVVSAEVVSGFGLRHKICEAEEEVCQYDTSHFIESLHNILEPCFKWPVPLKIDT